MTNVTDNHADILVVGEREEHTTPIETETSKSPTVSNLASADAGHQLSIDPFRMVAASGFACNTPGGTRRQASKLLTVGNTAAHEPSPCSTHGKIIELDVLRQLTRPELSSSEDSLELDDTPKHTSNCQEDWAPHSPSYKSVGRSSRGLAAMDQHRMTSSSTDPLHQALRTPHQASSLQRRSMNAVCHAQRMHHSLPDRHALHRSSMTLPTLPSTLQRPSLSRSSSVTPALRDCGSLLHMPTPSLSPSVSRNSTPLHEPASPPDTPVGTPRTTGRRPEGGPFRASGPPASPTHANDHESGQHAHHHVSTHTHSTVAANSRSNTLHGQQQSGIKPRSPVSPLSRSSGARTFRNTSLGGSFRRASLGKAGAVEAGTRDHMDWKVDKADLQHYLEEIQAEATAPTANEEAVEHDEDSAQGSHHEHMDLPSLPHRPGGLVRMSSGLRRLVLRTEQAPHALGCHADDSYVGDEEQNILHYATTSLHFKSSKAEEHASPFTQLQTYAAAGLNGCCGSSRDVSRTASHASFPDPLDDELYYSRSGSLPRQLSSEARRAVARRASVLEEQEMQYIAEATGNSSDCLAATTVLPSTRGRRPGLAVLGRQPSPGGSGAWSHYDVPDGHGGQTGGLGQRLNSNFGHVEEHHEVEGNMPQKAASKLLSKLRAIPRPSF